MTLRTMKAGGVPVRKVPIRAGRVRLFRRVYVYPRMLLVRLAMIALALAAVACSGAAMVSVYLLGFDPTAAAVGVSLTILFSLAVVLLDEFAGGLASGYADGGDVS